MKKLVVLLSALLILTTFASSPVLAARPTLEYRIHSILALFCRNAFPFSGMFIVPGEIDAINSGTREPIVGGDADDYADGKVLPPPNDTKAGDKIVRGVCDEETRAPLRGTTTSND